VCDALEDEQVAEQENISQVEVFTGDRPEQFLDVKLERHQRLAGHVVEPSRSSAIAEVLAQEADEAGLAVILVVESHHVCDVFRFDPGFPNPPVPFPIVAQADLGKRPDPVEGFFVQGKVRCGKEDLLVIVDQEIGEHLGGPAEDGRTGIDDLTAGDPLRLEAHFHSLDGIHVEEAVIVHEVDVIRCGFLRSDVERSPCRTSSSDMAQG